MHPYQAEVEYLLRVVVEVWRAETPKLDQRAELNLPEGPAVFDPSHSLRVRMRTPNCFEHIDWEIAVHTRRFHLPNTASCLRSV